MVSSSACVTIKVHSVNDPPAAEPKLVPVGEGASGVIVDLMAVDVDEIDPLDRYTYNPSFADTLFTKVTAWPALGRVYQTSADGHKLDEIEDLSDQLEATGSAWASEIVRFSSQVRVRVRPQVQFGCRSASRPGCLARGLLCVSPQITNILSITSDPKTRPF